MKSLFFLWLRVWVNPAVKALLIQFPSPGGRDREGERDDFGQTHRPSERLPQSVPSIHPASLKLIPPLKISNFKAQAHWIKRAEEEELESKVLKMWRQTEPHSEQTGSHSQIDRKPSFNVSKCLHHIRGKWVSVSFWPTASEYIQQLFPLKFPLWQHTMTYIRQN